jgi:gliding motility-associated-like protein
MKKKLLSIFLLISPFITQYTFAQCPVSAKANVVNIQCGDTVLLNALATAGDYVINNNFENPATQRPGAEWAQSPSATYTNPCGPNPAGSTVYYWLGDQADVPRSLQSIPFDLTTGGYIKWDMKFATQGNTSPCEGPDLPDEGVFLQYRVGGGAWITIDYFSPNGGTDPFRTNWNTYQYTIPAAACQPGTAIRWIQINSSGNVNDHWGLDNIQIVRNDPTFRFDWTHDPNDPSTTGATPPVVPYTDTTYYVTYYRQGGTLPTDTCRAQVSINTVLPTGVISANPTQVCPPATSQLDVIASFIPPLPATCGLSASGCVGQSAKFTLGTAPITEPTTGGYRMFGRTNSVNAGVITVSSCNCITGGNEVSNCDKTGRTQFIVLKSEMPAIFPGGQINSLDLNISDIFSATYQNFTIRIGCTSKTQFTSNTDFETGLVTVHTPKTVNLITGWSTFLFDQAFDWPGTGNVVIEVTWAANNYSSGNVQKMATTNFMTIHSYSCAQNPGGNITNGATRYQNRPFVRLGYCYRPIPTLTYTWTPAANLNNAGIKNPVATTYSTTNYQVVVSDAKRPNCSLTKTVNVSVVAPVVAVSPRTTVVCNPGTAVPLTATATPSTSGGSITTYSWQPTTGLSNPNIANPTASPTVTTTYKCFVTDNTGCVGVDSLTITINPSSNATATNNGPICEGQTLSLSTPNLAGAAYSWSGPNFYTSNLRTPTISNVDSSHAGTYSVTVTLPGCNPTVGTTSVTITKKGKPTVNYGTGTFCKTGGNPTPTVSEAGTFSSAPAGLQFVSTSTGEINLAGSTVGNYNITFTPLSTLCNTAITFPVSIVNSFAANFAYPQPACVGGNDTLKPTFNNGGTPGTFSVTSANASDLVFISANSGFIDLKRSKAGTYTIRNFLPASAGCAAAQYTFTVQLDDGPVPTWSGLTEGDQFCKNVSTIKVLTPLQSGGIFSGAGVYRDTDNKYKFNPTLANGDTAFIKYRITNNSGCKDSLSKKVVLNDFPRPTIVGPDSICTGQTVGLSHNETGKAYLWSPGGQTSRFLNDFPSANTQYILTVTNLNDCIGKDTFNVVVKPKPQPQITGDFSICEGESSLLTASGATSFIWNPGNITSSQYNVSPTTTTTYSLIGAFANGCIDSTKQTITVNPLPTVGLGDFANMCENAAPITLSGGTPSGGEYIINGAASSTNFNPSTWGVGTHEINYVFTDANNCTANQAKNIMVLAIPARPNVNFIGTPCIGNSMRLSTPSVMNATYLWSGPEFTNNPSLDKTLREPVINPLSAGSAGQYQVSITVANCTSNPGDSSLAVSPLPAVAINPNTIEICEDGVASLTANVSNGVAVASWVWATTDPNGIVNPNTNKVQVLPRNPSAIYNARATSSVGCIGTASSTVNLIYYPEVDLGPDQIACIEDQVTLQSTRTYGPGITYNWYPVIHIPNGTEAVQTFKALVQDSLMYFLMVGDRGCETTDSVLLVVRDCSIEPALVVPNAFSPNGDVSNETFLPLSKNLATFEMQIYNRWGEKLFTTNDKNNGWDGKVNGEIIEQDVYVYIINAIDLNGRPIKKMGTVTLLK